MLSRIPNPLVFWRLWIAVLAPVLLLPVPLLGDEANRNALWCGWTILVMAVFWISEVLPLAITSLLPLLLLPLSTDLTTNEVSLNYLKATNMMFVAGLMMAIAVEHCGLHHRIALSIITAVGTSSNLIMLGFMACSMFLSMWISNTATTAMMVPIVDAISEAISSTGDPGEEMEDAERSKRRPTEAKRSKSQEVMRNFLLLAVAYASNIGGTGVITGSPPNLVVLDVLDQQYGSGATPLTYASWMGFCVPLMLVNTVLAWGWLVILKKLYSRGQGSPSQSADQELKIKKVICEKKAKLGKMSGHEIQVLVLFIILILLWFFQKPKFIPGWGTFFQGLHPATPAILIVAVTFLLPKTWSLHKSSDPLLDWHTGLLLLMLLQF